jgi:hypothetical protein
MIRIIAKKDGFRRAGVAHAGVKLWPDGSFTPEELAALQAEPNLIVEEFDEEAFVEEISPGKYAAVPEAFGPLRAVPDIAESAPPAPEEGEPAPPAPKDGKGKK